MLDILTIENLFALVMLVLLQAVLGFDNLLYISIESKRVEASQQAEVRRIGILMAIALRIVLLFIVVQAIAYFQDPLFTLPFTGVLEGVVNGHSIIVLFGGAFIIYTAMKEIMHMLAVHDPDVNQERAQKSVANAVFWIVLMNLIFSFDSILSALALTDVFLVMAAAIIISGVMMIVLADRVADFLSANRMYEVLGLFILLIVGVVLLGEAGQAAAHAMHDDSLALKFFGYEVVPMSKTTFYFSVVVLVIVEVIQSGYTRKLNAERRTAARH